MYSSKEIRFLRKHYKLICKLTKTLHFSKSEIERICIIYYQFEKKGGLSKDKFLNVLRKAFDFTEEMMIGRVSLALDKSPGKYVNLEIWAKTLSLLLRGYIEEKIRFCFEVYDVTNNASLKREVLFSFLRHSLLSQTGEEDAEDAVKDMIEVLTKKMDLDRDGKISFDDYRTMVITDQIMLEIFGQCLPSAMAIQAFLSTFVC